MHSALPRLIAGLVLVCLAAECTSPRQQMAVASELAAAANEIDGLKNDVAQLQTDIDSLKTVLIKQDSVLSKIVAGMPR